MALSCSALRTCCLCTRWQAEHKSWPKRERQVVRADCLWGPRSKSTPHPLSFILSTCGVNNMPFLSSCLHARIPNFLFLAILDQGCATEVGNHQPTVAQRTTHPMLRFEITLPFLECNLDCNSMKPFAPSCKPFKWQRQICWVFILHVFAQCQKIVLANSLIQRYKERWMPYRSPARQCWIVLRHGFVFLLNIDSNTVSSFVFIRLTALLLSIYLHSNHLCCQHVLLHLSPSNENSHITCLGYSIARPLYWRQETTTPHVKDRRRSTKLKSFNAQLQGLDHKQQKIGNATTKKHQTQNPGFVRLREQLWDF